MLPYIVGFGDAGRAVADPAVKLGLSSDSSNDYDRDVRSKCEGYGKSMRKKPIELPILLD
jgi:hypothetical protein